MAKKIEVFGPSHPKKIGGRGINRKTRSNLGRFMQSHPGQSAPHEASFPKTEEGFE